jgi:hypothetical protein
MNVTPFPTHPFTMTDCRALGIPRRRVAAAVRNGVLVRLFRNAYVIARPEMTVEERAYAASLVISGHAVICDRTAAWIWGVDCFRWRELDVAPPLESFTTRGHRASARADIRSGQRDLGPNDFVTVSGVRVTTPLRTALDLGCRLSRRDALAAIDALMRAQRLTTRQLVAALPGFAGRRGVVQLRELVALADGRAESQGESWTRIELHDHGLPRPELQWWVTIEGVPTFRLDLAYPHARIAIEYDGEAFHSSPADKRADSERRAWLERHGWVVIVVDKSSFSDEALDAWIDDVRRALAEAHRPPVRRFVRS